jgi:hypothetical protein
MKTKKFFSIKRNNFLKKIKRKENLRDLEILEKTESLEEKFEKQEPNQKKESENKFGIEITNNTGGIEESKESDLIENKENEETKSFQLEELLTSKKDNSEKNKEDKENLNSNQNPNILKTNLEESLPELKGVKNNKDSSEILYSSEIKNKDYILDLKELKVNPLDNRFNSVSKIDIEDRFYNLDNQEEKKYFIEKPDFILSSFNPEKDQLKESYILFKKDRKFKIW